MLNMLEWINAGRQQIMENVFGGFFKGIFSYWDILNHAKFYSKIMWLKK